MFSIGLNNVIKVVKGDTGIINLTLDNYTFKDGDIIYLTVKKDYNSPAVLKKKVIDFTNGSAKIIFNKDDTNIEVGNYIYDIQCNLLDGRIDTIIISKFNVLGGVTDE